MDRAISVMIADSSDSFKTMLSELIDKEKDMSVAGRAEDGKQAMELVQKLRPDVLITELMLREVDGTCLIRSLKQEGKLPHTIVVSGFFNDRLAGEVSQLGVDYFFPKPCRVEGLIECIRECVAENAEASMEKRLDRAADSLAYEAVSAFGMMPHLLGFKYLRAGVRLVSTDRCPLRGVTKILYPDLAKMHGTDPSSVERCIRHAIQAAWDEGDIQERTKYFGNTFSAFRKAPTNSELLAILVEWVKRQLREREWKK